MAAGEDAVAAGFIVERSATGPLEVAELDAELDQATLHACHVASAVRHVELGGGPLLDCAAHDPGMDQHIPDAAPGDRDRLGPGGAAAADLSRNEGLAERLGRRVVHAERVELEQH